MTQHLNLVQIIFKKNLNHPIAQTFVNDPTTDFFINGDIIQAVSVDGVVRVFPRENIVEITLNKIEAPSQLTKEEENDNDSVEESQGEETPTVDSGADSEEDAA